MVFSFFKKKLFRTFKDLFSVHSWVYLTNWSVRSCAPYYVYPCVDPPSFTTSTLSWTHICVVYTTHAHFPERVLWIRPRKLLKTSQCFGFDPLWRLRLWVMIPLFGKYKRHENNGIRCQGVARRRWLVGYKSTWDHTVVCLLISLLYLGVYTFFLSFLLSLSNFHPRHILFSISLLYILFILKTRVCLSVYFLSFLKSCVSS